MSGLINQARTQLWKIVNELAKLELAGKTPTLEVALYEYGKSSLPAADGYMRRIVPLTDDLDKVSEELFKLTTNGGSEYCGQVIDLATRELQWSQSEKDLKCIFIAGNEPFTQGPVDYQQACRKAAETGITVSTIFCGNHEEGIRTQWEHGAKLADGAYCSIDHDRAVATINTPQDKELAKLSAELSDTYVPFGQEEKRREAAERQKAQDANAAKAAVAAAAARATFKASGLYRAGDWDLVDALKDGKVKLEEVAPEQLPEPMREMTVAERKAHLEKLAEKRAKIQTEIKELTAARDKYVAKEQARMAAEAPAAAAPEPALDRAIIEAVQQQAGKK